LWALRGGALRWALRRPARCSAPPLAQALVLGLRLGGFAPPPTLLLTPRIIYDGNDSINNSRNHKNTPRPQGRSPPPRAEPESVAGGATPPNKRGWRRNALF